MHLKTFKTCFFPGTTNDYILLTRYHCFLALPLFGLLRAEGPSSSL